MIPERNYKSGEIIIKENDPGETAYIIKHGRVKVIKDIAGTIHHLCDLGEGSIFGEMSMIDDMPRSATVISTDETIVHEVQRDNFFESLKTDQELALKLLKVLFERLRKANVTIARLRAEDPASKSTSSPPRYSVSPRPITVIWMKGLTPQAAKSLPENPYPIKKFPFLIGRKTKDPFAYNDLMIADKPPYRISRHHIELDSEEGRVVALDRGSHLGSFVDGRQLGGTEGGPGPLMFQPSGGTLILGEKQSPYKYKLSIDSK